MKKLTLIGDVHGKYAQYKQILKKYPNTIQVGDMGVGFRRTQEPRAGEFTQNPPHDSMVAANGKFIRGNHDNPAECRKHSQWIADGTVEDGIMFIGGAVSVDRAWRIKDYSWWVDEELSSEELYLLVDRYIQLKPRVMVTHDAPEEVAAVVMQEQLAVTGNYRGQKLDPEHSSRSRQAFQQMWSAHTPELWVFGHWHYSFDHVLRGTRFVCLNELEVKEFEI